MLQLIVVALVLLQFTEMRILWHHQAMTSLRAGFQTRSTNNDWHHSLLRPPSLETEAPKLRIVYLQRFCFVLPVLDFPIPGNCHGLLLCKWDGGQKKFLMQIFRPKKVVHFTASLIPLSLIEATSKPTIYPYREFERAQARAWRLEINFELVL